MFAFVFSGFCHTVCFFFFCGSLVLVKAILRKELSGIEVEKLNAENIVSVARA